jgi:hypothetical protein
MLHDAIALDRRRPDDVVALVGYQESHLVEFVVIPICAFDLDFIILSILCYLRIGGRYGQGKIAFDFAS